MKHRMADAEMKVMIVIGTRPQVIKTSVLMDAFDQIGVDTVLAHTGQHYDTRLSDVFFQELQIREPDYNLGVGSGTYRYQVQVGVQRLVEVVEQERPDWILTIGDSNPALVGSLGAVVQGVKLAHSEAGLRSGNTREPEERNRILVDSLSDYLFCSTQECYSNLEAEVVSGMSLLTGDLLCDAWKRYEHLVDRAQPTNLARELRGSFCLFTLHRRSNAYNPVRLKRIASMLLEDWHITTVWPVHPGVRKELDKLNLWTLLETKQDLLLVPPATYLEMRWLEKNCTVVATDSVGLQVEAYLARKPSIILRHEIEYQSLESQGWSIRVEPDRIGLAQCAELIRDIDSHTPREYDDQLFGSGDAAFKMAQALASG